MPSNSISAKMNPANMVINLPVSLLIKLFSNINDRQLIGNMCAKLNRIDDNILCAYYQCAPTYCII